MKNIFNLFIVYGFIMIIGTAGSSDVGSMTFNQCILQILIASGIFSFGVVGKRVLAYVKILKLNKLRKQKFKARLRLPKTA